MRRSVIVLVLLIAATGWLAPGPAFAQATGTISGVVTDESGAVMPGVTLAVANTATGPGPDGRHRQRRVLLRAAAAARPLLVKATLQGFRPAVRQGVTRVGRRHSRVDVKLGVGRRRRNRDRHRRSAARRNSARHARHHGHRPAEGRRAAAERPQLHAARHADSRRRRAAVRARRIGRRRDARRVRRHDRGLQRQRHAEPVQQLPARRREQQRHLQHRVRHAAAARRHPGIQDPDALLYARNTAATPAPSSTSSPRRAPTTCTAPAWEFNRDDALQARNFFAPASQAKPGAASRTSSAPAPAGRSCRTSCSCSDTTRATGTRGQHDEHRRAVGRAAAGQFSGGAAIKDPLTGLPFPGNVIPPDRLSPRRSKLLDDFVPNANSGANRYIASPRDHGQPQLRRSRVRLPAHRPSTRCSVRFLRDEDRPRAAAGRCTHGDRQHGEGNAAATTWRRTRYMFAPHAINVGAVLVQPHRRATRR